MTTELTGIAWRGWDGANDCVLLGILLDGEVVASLVEYRRALWRVDDADEDFGVLRCPQTTAVDGGNIQPMIRLVPARQQVRSRDEDLAGHSINSEDSGVVSSHDAVRDGAESSRIGIAGNDSHNWSRRWQWLTQRNVVFAGIKDRPIIINIGQLYFDHRRRTQATCKRDKGNENFISS